MSRTSQRKFNMIYDGYEDAVSFRSFMWARHENIKKYSFGYSIGIKVRNLIIQRMVIL